MSDKNGIFIEGEPIELVTYSHPEFGSGEFKPNNETFQSSSLDLSLVTFTITDDKGEKKVIKKWMSDSDYLEMIENDKQ